MKRIALLLLLAPVSGLSAATTYYIDSGAVGASSNVGTQANPWTNFASISPWAAGNTYLLKRGSVYRTASLVPGAHGSNGLPITIGDYGNPTLAKPVIRGDTNLTGFVQYTPGLGSTWSNACAQTVSLAWKNGFILKNGSGAATLNNMEWFYGSGIFYIRDDSGNPDSAGATIEGSTVAIVLDARKNFVNVSNLKLMRGNSRGIQGNNTNLVVRGCDFYQNSTHFSSTADSQFFNCTFIESYTVAQGFQVSGVTCDCWFCLFAGLDTDVAASGQALVKITAGTNRFINCTFMGSTGQSVLSSTTGINGFTNCIFDAQQSYDVSSTAGTSYLAYCSFVPSFLSGTSFWTNGTTDGGHCIIADPRFMLGGRTGIVAPVMDDAENWNEFTNVAKLAEWHGYKYTYALSTSLATNTLWTPTGSVPAAQSMILRGHSVANHSRDHADLIFTNAFQVRYTGSGASCSFVITHSPTTNLSTTTGVGADDINFDLTSSSYNTMSNLIAAIAAKNGGSKYTCTAGAPSSTHNNQVWSYCLSDTNIADIKPATTNIFFDSSLFYSNEIAMPFLDLTGLFTNIDGSSYTQRAFIYPYGTQNGDVINRVSSNHIAARTTTEGVPISRQVALYVLPTLGGGASTAGRKQSIWFESGGAANTGVADQSGNTLTFTANNLTYDSAAPIRGVSAGIFNGTTTYLNRANDANFDFSTGEWAIGMWCKITNNGAVRTLWNQCTDSNNRFDIYIDAGGFLNLKILTGGAAVLTLTSPSAIETNVWHHLCAEERGNRYTLLMDDGKICAVDSTVRAATYTGSEYIGCGFNGSTRENFFLGDIDNFEATRMGYTATQSLAAWISHVGGFIVPYSHNGSAMLWRIFFDAMQDSHQPVKIMTFDNAVNTLKLNGVLDTGSQTCRWYQASSPNWNLQPGSPVIGAGTSSVLSGVTNLVDLNGRPVTDANGVLLLPAAQVSLGAYQAVHRPRRALF